MEHIEKDHPCSGNIHEIMVMVFPKDENKRQEFFDNLESMSDSEGLNPADWYEDYTDPNGCDEFEERVILDENGFEWLVYTGTHDD